MKINKNNIHIGIFGLGYVGLPLAIEFGKKFNVIGFDLDKYRLEHLKKNNDLNNDIKKIDFIKSKFLSFTNDYKKLSNCNVYIVTVPTPINKKKIPDLTLIKKACKTIGLILKKNDTVIFESTVYPGLTEEICVPLLEKNSNLVFNKDFYCGYSPERINPNDKIHTITKIIKITSGSNKRTSDFVDKLYSQIIKAGTYKVSSIKIAEAAKVIENAQRDINIAFVNELTLIFDKLNLDTSEVLKAAQTKWNFIKFKPGLVGGHCIGVDPYYLTHRSKLSGYKPKVITAGREVNDNIVDYVIKKTFRTISKIYKTNKFKILVMGLSFKENCSDYRNSKSVEIVNKLIKKKYIVDCFDPPIDKKDFIKKNNIKLLSKIKNNYYHCVMLTVAHEQFIKMGQKNIEKYLLSNGKIFDIKRILPKSNKNIYL